MDWVELDSDNWTKIRFVQALYSNSAIDESPSKVEQTSSSPEIQQDIPTPGDPLPPISEEDSTDSYFKMDGELDEDMMKALKEANHYALHMSDDLYSLCVLTANWDEPIVPEVCPIVLQSFSRTLCEWL